MGTCEALGRQGDGVWKSTENGMREQGVSRTIGGLLFFHKTLTYLTQVWTLFSPRQHLFPSLFLTATSRTC